jgi:hypothetical protein
MTASVPASIDMRFPPLNVLFVPEFSGIDAFESDLPPKT